MDATLPNRPAVKYKDLREYLDLLESKRLLHRITASVDPHLEIGAIAARSLERKGPALWFENVKGYEGMPFVTNIISTTQQLGATFDTEPNEEAIHERVVDGMDRRIPSVTLPTGPCKEVVIGAADVDIDLIPTPLWHEHDGGRYLGTTAGIVTRDPVTGFLNMGAYRVMIKDKKTLSLSGGLRGRNASSGPGGGDHVLENEARNQPTPVAIVMGMDPLLTLANGSPVRPSDDGSMEYEAAGGWRGAPTELVKCETSDLLVPAHAEMVIEGIIPPHARTEEGPHGESTGFYGENKMAFVVEITCITHRRNPVTYGLICQRVEDYPRQLLRSGSLQSRIIQKTGFTNIRQVYFPEVGRHGMLIVSAKIRDKEDPRRIMNGIWEDSGERWRWIIVVDEDCNVRDWDEVMWRVVSAADPDHDVFPGKIHNAPKRNRGEVDFDPPRRGMGIDATMRFKDAKFPPVNKVSEPIMAKVVARWKEYGLP
ncbi:MAG: UbiD family decarboxylase [Alphaproteobacteria bacterium]|nr:UbiD family decarboxylase [Alphaproteobacteria bacterium]